MLNNPNTLAIILGTLGIIFMMAMAFQILSWNWAIFLGVSCFMLAGMMRRIAAQKNKGD